MSNSAFTRVQRAVASRVPAASASMRTREIRRMYHNGIEPRAIATELRIALPQVFAALQKPGVS